MGESELLNHYTMRHRAAGSHFFLSEVKSGLWRFECCSSAAPTAAELIGRLEWWPSFFTIADACGCLEWASFFIAAELEGTQV